MGRFYARDFAPSVLAGLKLATGRTVSVCIPARDEASTVGPVVAGVATLAGPGGLVDEIVVVDDGSADATGEVAAAAGAIVVATGSRSGGKGAALQAGLAASTGEIVVFLDADLTSFDPGYVTGLLGPLLSFGDVSLVKATYDRLGGGRVNELVARPLIGLLLPHLSDIDQPLGGELAAHRWLLESLPFVCGYGVDVALLADSAARVGIDAVSQVHVGVRTHRNRPLSELRHQAREVVEAVLDRAGVLHPGGARPSELPPLAAWPGPGSTARPPAPPTRG